MTASFDYPRMLYADDGRTMTVQNEEQEAAADGFGREPADIHRNPVADRSAVARVDTSGRDDLIEKLIDRMREEFFGGADDQASDRPRRGRPPNVTRQRAGTASLPEGNDYGR